MTGTAARTSGGGRSLDQRLELHARLVGGGARPELPGTWRVELDTMASARMKSRWARADQAQRWERRARHCPSTCPPPPRRAGQNVPPTAPPPLTARRRPPTRPRPSRPRAARRRRQRYRRAERRRAQRRETGSAEARIHVSVICGPSPAAGLRGCGASGAELVDSLMGRRAAGRARSGIGPSASRCAAGCRRVRGSSKARSRGHEPAARPRLAQQRHSQRSRAAGA